VHHIDAGNDLQQKFFGNAARPSEAALKRVGKQALDRFVAGTPGLGRLRARLAAQVDRDGWLPGLDGRRVPARAQYSALNFQVTSAEAVICKRWLVNVFDELNEKFRYGWDGDCVIALWIHDEIAVCCRPEIADQVGEIMVRHAKEPGEFYKFKVPLDADYTIGKSWAGNVAEGAAPSANPSDSGPSTEASAGATVIDKDTGDVGIETRAEPDRKDDIPAPEEIVDLPWIDVKALFKAPQSGNGRDGGYPHGERRKGRHIATYLYRNHLGQPHTKVEKRASPGAKHAQYPQSFCVNGTWVSKKPAGWPKIPYRLPEMLAALASNPRTDVFIPEGEKDCETLAALGCIATTSSEGATNPKSKKGSNWTPELNKWFAGVQRAFILEDNDEPGRNFAREKARSLAGIVPDIRIVSFTDVPESEDVTYWLEHGHTKDELLARCEGVERWQGGGVLESVRLDQIPLRAIRWLWLKRFALSKIGIIAGLPDVGKGQILCYIAARITRALEWPNGEGRSPQGNVIILSAEENPNDSLGPRLAAADADLSRIHFVSMVRDHDIKTGQQRKRMFSLVSDLEKLRHKIAEVGDVVGILIDPVSAYLGIGEIDSYRDTDVRAALGPLKDLAEEMRVAIIGVMHFNKKVDITNALLRVSNSLAFVGLPRHVYGVISDVANMRKLFVRAKNNDAAESDNQTLAFHFDVRQVGIDPDNQELIKASYIIWDQGYVDVTATEAMQAASENKSPGERDKAKNLLLEILSDSGEALVDDIKDTAEGHGISWRTMRRAADDLKVIIDKDRTTPKGKWFWKL
jgi:hypothetical protein